MSYTEKPPQPRGLGTRAALARAIAGMGQKREALGVLKEVEPLLLTAYGTSHVDTRRVQGWISDLERQ